MIGRTYYISGAVTAASLGIVNTAADVIGSLLCKLDNVEIELTDEDMKSIASDLGLDFTLCPSLDCQPQNAPPSQDYTKAAASEEETSRLKEKSYVDLQQELDSSKQNLASMQTALADAKENSMQESLHLQAKIDKQSGSLEALQGLLRPMQAENKSIVKENERLGLEVARLEKLNMAASLKKYDMWGPGDFGVQQHKADVPASPCFPLHNTYPTMQGVNGVFKMGSPTSSDDDSIKSFKLELEESMAKQQQDWAEQLAEQQRLVQQWQDESWKITLSLEQKELDLDEALEREQGLQSSLTSLQHHMDRHEHLIVIPTSRLNADWVIGRELGRGANAVVLAASHRCLPGIVLKKGYLEDLEAEAHKMWLAQHPCLVRILGKVSTTEEDPNDGSPLVYLALERLGPNLASLLRSGRRFTVKEQVMLLQQVAAALGKLHAEGIVHQDLHSDNVLQALDGLQYKVSDLGNAAFHKIEGQPNELLHSKCGLGIESPQLATDMMLDGKYQPLFSSDVWAFGLLALELAGGSKPAEHSRLVKEYLRQRGHHPTTSPAQGDLYTYLMDLAAEDPPEDYANQIKLPPVASGPDAQAATDLQAVIRGCLHSYESNRLHAVDASRQLFGIMSRQGWIHQADTSAKSKSKSKRKGRHA